jgi:hypothetical protein
MLAASKCRPLCPKADSGSPPTRCPPTRSPRASLARIERIAREEMGIAVDTALRLGVYFHTTPSSVWYAIGGLYEDCQATLSENRWFWSIMLYAFASPQHVEHGKTIFVADQALTVDQ